MNNVNEKYLISVSFVNWTPALQLSSRLRAQDLISEILQTNSQPLSSIRIILTQTLRTRSFSEILQKNLNHSFQSESFLREPWGQALISKILQKILNYSVQSESSLREPCKCRLYSCECCAWRIQNNHHSWKYRNWKSPNHLELYFVFPHVHKSWKST